MGGQSSGPAPAAGQQGGIFGRVQGAAGAGQQMALPGQMRPPPPMSPMGGLVGIEPRGMGGPSIPEFGMGGPGFTGGEPALPPPAPAAPPAPAIPRNRMGPMIASLRKAPLGGDF